MLALAGPLRPRSSPAAQQQLGTWQVQAFPPSGTPPCAPVAGAGCPAAASFLLWPQVTGPPRTAAAAAAGPAVLSSTGGQDKEEEVDASVRVKIMLAEGSGKLDLSECNLTTIPPAVFELTGAVVSRVCTFV